MDSYRIKVVETLKKIFKDKSYSNIVINNDIKNIDLKHQALYRKSVLGVVEHLIFIDWVINQVSNTKTKKMETDVLVVLRLAVYQIFFLDNSHENMVVSESVQYIKDKGNLRASKFINGVLRNILRQRQDLLVKMEKLPREEYLSVKYSYPEALVKRWQLQFGKDKIEEVLSSNNAEAPLEIRVNTLKISRDDLIKIFHEKGIVAEKCKYAEKGIQILNPVETDKTDEYKKGLFSIQSESSMLAGQILNPDRDKLLIDMCAAPGGKSLNAAEIMENTGKIISRDIYPGKLSLIEKEKARLGISNIKVEAYDATIMDESLKEKADFIIADVPCSGLGIIRRKPEIKYNRTEEEIKEISKIQLKILINAAGYMKKGGKLVYSTCTTNKEENLDIVMEFLKHHKDFALEGFSDIVNHDFPDAAKGYIEIYPHVHGMDGFFIAKIKRL